MEVFMKVQILGSGCPKCKALEANARQAVETLSLAAEIVKITDIDKIMEMGVMMTPALAIDGDVKSVGKILTKDQIIDVLKGGK
jgi:small redox-active disulfide protein 2